MADLHLGAMSDPKLRELERSTLKKAFEICEERQVDFVIIAGDIFHVNIPDLMVVKEAARVFRSCVESGRKIYVVYGSHDFSPNSTSIIDILEAAGILIRVGKPEYAEGLLRPSIVHDEASGVVLTGISGRRASLEKEAFAYLDRDYLLSLNGFKIFIFHTGLDEIRRENERFEGVSLSDLPEGFNYYAGGHIHRRIEIRKGKRAIYPGPLFTGWGADLEATVKGEKRGFYIVEACNGEVETEFVDITPFEGVYNAVDATGLSVHVLNEKLDKWVAETDVEGKLVVLKVFGELTSGKSTEVDFGFIRETLAKKGALYLHLSRNLLKTREYAQVTMSGETNEEIETHVFEEMAGTVKSKDEKLRIASTDLAKQLLHQLRSPKIDGETQDDYDSRILIAAKEALGLK